jgi:hypothetical protein
MALISISLGVELKGMMGDMGSVRTVGPAASSRLPVAAFTGGFG